MRLFFIFDVESVGLHGEGFAVAGGLYLQNGIKEREFVFACPMDTCQGDPEGRAWVKANVPPLIGTHPDPRSMRTAFWAEWLVAKKLGAVAAAECGWPVEARFLIDCINDDLDSRMWEGPYPLHEIASFMVAAGMDPMAKYDRKPSELPIHQPLSDARLSARLLAEAIQQTTTDAEIRTLLPL